MSAQIGPFESRVGGTLAVEKLGASDEGHKGLGAYNVLFDGHGVVQNGVHSDNELGLSASVKPSKVQCKYSVSLCRWPNLKSRRTRAVNEIIYPKWEKRRGKINLFEHVVKDTGVLVDPSEIAPSVQKRACVYMCR